MTDVTRQLARFIVNSRWDEAPQEIRHEAERALLLNALNAALVNAVSSNLNPIGRDSRRAC